MHQDAFREFKIGGYVTTDIFFTEALRELGYPPKQPIRVDQLLVGELCDYDDEMNLIDKQTHCLLNGSLPCGTIISANVQFFKPVTV